MIYKNNNNDIEEFCTRFKERAVNFFGNESPCLSLYLRGSFISENIFNPLDIDFVLFVENKENYDDFFRNSFVDFVSDTFPGYPLADLSIYSNNLASPESLYGQILICNSSKLVVGRDNRVNKIIIYRKTNIIIDYYIKHCNNKIIVFSNCSRCEAEQRSPHLAKAVLRLGGLLLMKRGMFSRDVEECSNEILNEIPSLSSSISMLKDTFDGTFNKELILQSSRLILMEFKKLLNIR